jgi:2-polyprenyl-3-methyl-5-hydroxy-6-metoxy-1,4-benzoquinol methylase
MFSASKLDHETRNQANYNEKAKEHDTLGLNSTLYLAYRDINSLLERHLYPKLTSKKIRLLDFGCGVGLSTDIVLRHLNAHNNYVVEAIGVDVNEANLEIATGKVQIYKY